MVEYILKSYCSLNMKFNFIYIESFIISSNEFGSGFIEINVCFIDFLLFIFNQISLLESSGILNQLAALKRFCSYL